MKAVVDYLVVSREALQAAIDDEVFCRTVADIAERVARALLESGKLFLPAELVGRLNYDRVSAR